MRQGDIAFSGKYKFDIFSSGVKFFTKSKWSHCFFVMGDVLGETSIIEADLNCHVVPWQREYVEKKADYWEVWRPTKASQEAIEAASKKCYHEYSGAVYGFLQIPWFAYRGILRFLGLDAKNNWKSDGVICSELLFDFLWELGGEYREIIEEMTANEVSPEDLYRKVKARPDLFEFVMERSDTDPNLILRAI